MKHITTDRKGGILTEVEYTQRRAYPCRQLIRTERLHDVIAGTGLQPVDDIVYVVRTGQEDDRQVTSPLAQFDTEIAPIAVREIDIQDQCRHRIDLIIQSHFGLTQRTRLDDAELVAS